MENDPWYIIYGSFSIAVLNNQRVSVKTLMLNNSVRLKKRKYYYRWYLMNHDH